MATECNSQQRKTQREPELLQQMVGLPQQLQQGFTWLQVTVAER